MHHPPPRDRYALRNEPSISFRIESTTQGGGTQGAVTRSTITKNDGRKFRFEVVFEGEYAATKENFDAQMYEDTALSLVRSQLESRVYRDTRIVLKVNSGLPISDTNVRLEWD